MKINRINITLIILFPVFLSALSAQRSIATYRSQFTDAIIDANDTTGIGATMKIKEQLKIFSDEMAGSNNTNNNNYLEMWRIRHLFMNGKVQDAVDAFEILKSDKYVCDYSDGGTYEHKTMEECLKDDNCSTDCEEYQPFCGMEPYFKTIESCEEGCDCPMLEQLNPELDNLDFLKPNKLHEYFVDIGVEINRGDQSSIPIMEKAHVLSKRDNPIRLLLSPPKVKLRIDGYAKKSDKFEVWDYYYKIAQRRILEDIDSSFLEKDAHKLEFYDDYKNNDDIHYRFTYDNVPRVTGGGGDLNASHYKIYILDQGDAVDRYSFKLKQKEQKKNNIESLQTVLIRWDEDWVMQKYADMDHVFFLFPLLYENDYEIAGASIADPSELNEQNVTRLKTTINKKDFSDILQTNTDITEDETIEVYKIAYDYDEMGEIKLNYTDKYKMENEEVKKKKKHLLYTVIVCIAALLFTAAL